MLKSIWKDIKHAPRLGVGFLLRHPLAAMGVREARVPLKGVGHIHVRYGDSDADVVRQIFSGREYDLARFRQRDRVAAAYEAILSRGKAPLIIDAGANIGCTSIWFAMRFPQARILAVEPDVDNLAICARNVAPFSNVTLVAGAIGAQSGFASTSSPTGESDGIRTARTGDGGGVTVYSMADLFVLAGEASEPFIAKIDIEGFEADLFSTDVQWLDKFAVVMVELHDWMLPGQHASRSLQAAMFSRDFEMLINKQSLFFVR